VTCMHLAFNRSKTHIYICVTSYVLLCLIMGFYVYTYLWRI